MVKGQATDESEDGDRAHVAAKIGLLADTRGESSDTYLGVFLIFLFQVYCLLGHSPV